MQDMKIQYQVPNLIKPNFAQNPAIDADSASFGTALQESLDTVSRLQVEADGAIDDMASGRKTDIHQTMIAVEKASVSFELLMEIRNKVIAAYDKLMRTQV